MRVESWVGLCEPCRDERIISKRWSDAEPLLIKKRTNDTL